MKISLLVSVLILIAGGMIGWHDQRLLVKLRKDYRTLVTEAEGLGLPVDVLNGNAAAAPRLSERDRALRVEEVTAFAAELIAFAKRIEELEDAGESAEKENHREIILMMERLLELDSKELKMLVGEIRSAEDLSDDLRAGMVSFALTSLADQHPDAALALFVESADMLDEDEWVISSCLTKWAGKDPLAAVDWFRVHSKETPELVTSGTKQALVLGAATSDPAMAVRLIEELELEEPRRAYQQMALQVIDDEQRVAMLATARQLGSEESSAILKGLATGLVEEGFEETQKWLAGENLSEEELGQMALGLKYSSTGKETGKWLDWMGDRGEVPEEAVNNLMTQWTHRDFREAGKWLAEAKEGDMRNAAVVTYAGTVAPFDPEVAAQWAAVIPGGDDRDKLVWQIHSHWKRSDPAAAAAYAAQQGIEVKD